MYVPPWSRWGSIPQSGFSTGTVRAGLRRFVADSLFLAGIAVAIWALYPVCPPAAKALAGLAIAFIGISLNPGQ